MRMIDEIRERHRQRFVGRAVELERFAAMLDGGGSRVLWVFGPGGIGKSTLLDRFEREATARGRPSVVIDLRAVGEPRATLLDALGSHVPEAHAARPPVALIDSFEGSEDLGHWLRDELVAGLPHGSIVVVASRRPPSAGWRTDPVWSTALELMPLRSLSTADAGALLDRLTVTAALRPEAIRLSGGHPLALSLLAQYLATAEPPELTGDLAAAPDLVGTLLDRLVDEVPSPAHRAALNVLALARVTDRSLVRAATGHQGDEVFRWLETQPYVDRVDDGVCPHDLARDVLEADLRRDPDRYVEANRAIRSYLLDPERLVRAPDRCVKDFIYLHRSSSLLSGYWDWATYNSAHATPYHAGDDAALADIIRRHETRAAADCLSYWTARLPEAFTVVRSAAGEVLGVIGLLVLAHPDPDDLAADPAIASIWDHAARARPRRPGEVIGVLRFFDDAAAGQTVSPTFNVLSNRHTRHWLLTAGLTLDYIVVRDPEAWAPMMAYIDFHRAPDADAVLGGTHHHVFVHDWRQVTPSEWLDRMERLETGGPIPLRQTSAPVLVALDHDDFAAAVRAALRDLTKPSRLADNPLNRSRIVLDLGDTAGAAGVEQVVRKAFASLADDARTERARRALARTYLHGAVSQEAAAEVLGMAFSTYRRHLGAGVELLVEQLWRWELYGRHG